jgi:hypothetical protein
VLCEKALLLFQSGNPILSLVTLDGGDYTRDAAKNLLSA